MPTSALRTPRALTAHEMNLWLSQNVEDSPSDLEDSPTDLDIELWKRGGNTRIICKRVNWKHCSSQRIQVACWKRCAISCWGLIWELRWAKTRASKWDRRVSETRDTKALACRNSFRSQKELTKPKYRTNSTKEFSEKFGFQAAPESSPERYQQSLCHTVSLWYLFCPPQFGLTESKGRQRVGAF